MSSLYSRAQSEFTESLTKCLQKKDIEQLKASYGLYDVNGLDVKSALDQTFREFLFKTVFQNKSCVDFVDLSVQAVRNNLVTSALPITLLGDMFDAVTLDESEKLFRYVEDNVDVWKEPVFFSSCKNHLLRMCNDLLRRLSRSQNTVFCGRILLFLAKFFPFSERSGLNVVSEFNLENLTEYASDAIDIDDSLVDSEDVQVKIDYNLYCKFWGLQDFFRNPNQCYNTVQWKTFALHASSVLSAFNSFKLEEPRDSSSKNVKDDDQNEDVEMQEEIRTQHFFSKFLTNSKLLALQLSDSNFRRSVLVQCLILFQYLRSTVKFKAETFSLNASQSEFIKETEVQIYKLLEETPPCGKKFAKTVRHMLQREELWNTWKNDGCKEFKRPDVSIDESIKPPAKKFKRNLGDAIGDASKQNKFYMGNAELTRLWNLCPDNLQACRGADRNFLPSIEQYLENPKDKTDATFEWRALRLLARQSPHFFTMIQTPNKVADYLESVRKKISESRTKTKVDPVEPLNPVEIEEVQIQNTNEDGLTEDAEMLRSADQDDKNTHKTAIATPEQLKELSVIIGGTWQKLGSKLGYTPDLLKFFADSNTTNVQEQCRTMLEHWFNDDDDASLDNLSYILEGLDMIAGADAIKRFLEPVDKMEDISE
ncbi:hypothetical protein HA402_013175 [Bradysia odoriphaga]|nr:hypothetical protein HA402_013175 [Bradysia odoriphaga]